MTIRGIFNRFAVVMLATIGTTAAFANHTVISGPDRYDYPLMATDWSDCTGEWVDWQLDLTEFLYIHTSGNVNNQRFHYIVHFRWTGTATGQDSGFIWETHGGGKYTANFDPADFDPYHDVFIENAILDPIVPGAPKMKFKAQISFRVDQNGAPVLQQFVYEFRCLGNTTA